MASKPVASTVLLSLNIIFFYLITSTEGARLPSPGPSKHDWAPTPLAKKKKTCPKNAFKFGACIGMLNDLMHMEVGKPSKKPCCSMMNGMIEFEAAACLCIVMKANFMGFNMNIPFAMGMIMNFCGKNVPSGYECAKK